MTIQERLFQYKDPGYAAFQLKLIPGIPPESVIGVRVPVLREFAKELIKEGTYEVFLEELPHAFYDENMLHALIISGLTEYDACVFETERFLPYIDNWAVCDILSPRAFKKNKNKLICKIRDWTASSHTYTCRFGLGMLMAHYLDSEFREEYLQIPASIHSNEYYVNMMIAWFFATALSKQWDSVFPYFSDGKLDTWVNNKAIQKARESYRITQAQKELLKKYKK